MRMLSVLALLIAGFAVQAARAQSLDEQRISPEAGIVSTGAALLFTADGGGSWRDITPAGVARIDGATFIDAARGWALRSGPGGGLEMARTRDGGANWSSAPFALSADEAARFGGQAWLDFLDATHGWAMLRLAGNANFSNGALFATQDGGLTWRRLPTPPLGERVRFVTPKVGWLAGGPTGEALYVTGDGGVSWAAARAPVPAGVPAASVRYALPRAGHGVGIQIAADYGWANGSALALHQSADGGAGWRTPAVLAGPAPANPPALAVADGALIAVFADPAGRLTTLAVGGGAPRLGGRIAAGASVDGADFIDALQGWIVTDQGRCARAKAGCAVERRLLATADGGATYSDVTPAGVGPVAIADRDLQPGSVVLGAGEGFDACSPTTSGLAAWYANSPYRNVNVYIGGTNAYCPQPGLTTAWVNTVVGQGWGLIPTWVGLQAPCTSSTGSSRFSKTPATAAKQAASEARSAMAKMASVGLSGTIIYYDLEYYNDTPSCAAATKAFLTAWTQALHGGGYTSGVYGSPTNANADWRALASLPDAVWMALWDGHAVVFPLPPLPNSAWANHQRLHQYQGNVNQTWGGVRYNIDQDFLDGPVAK